MHTVRVLAGLLVLAAAWAVCPSSRGERLPFTAYTTSFPFTVTPPFWRRGWLLGAIAAAIAGAALGAHRFRVARAVELERVRTRIAILTESLQRRVGRDSSAVTAPLGRIAGLSRELVDSMSDIVWAINPKRDHWSDIVYRMRRFASDTFAGLEIEFDFEATEVERSIAGK